MSSQMDSSPSQKTAESAKPVTAGHDLLGQFANLPTAFKSASKEILSKEEYVARLEGLRQYPIKQLQDAGQFLAQLNRHNLKPEKRLQIAQSITGTVYPVMAKMYQQFQVSMSSLPEDSDRRQSIVASIDVVEQTAICCKHVFRDLYSDKSSHYQRHRERLQETGIRILEMLRLEQRLRALRHQKLPANAWKDTNRVFFSLLKHNDVDTKGSLLGNVGTWSRSDKNNNDRVMITPRVLYLSIQLFGLVDTPSWSTRLFHAPDGYIEILENALLISEDKDQEIIPGLILTGVDRHAPPLFQREAQLKSPRIVIDYSLLYNRLMQDYEELAKMKFIGKVENSRLNKVLLTLEPMERLPFLEAMLFGLRPRKRRQKRHAVFGQESLRLYFSFKEAFRLLIDIASPNLKHVANNRAFIDTLASQSAGVGDNGSYNQSKWEIANFSTGGILVVSRESAYTTPIQIGQIAAFISGKEMKRPLIGYITRLHRPNDQSIEVAIVRLSSHAEAAIVQAETGKFTGSRLGVILVKNTDNRWSLIARHEYDFVFGTPLRLMRENNQWLPARLGNVLLTRQEFVVFDLSAPGM